MKLNSYILTLLGAAALTSCSAVYEDLEPCPTGADVRLTYCNNMQGSDLFDSHVHCAKLLLYNGEGNFIGEYDYDGGPTMGLDLPVGHYYAIAYGGMSCEDAAYLFSNPLEENHHYTTVETYLRGTRSELADNLHSHFHGRGEFTVSDEDLTHIATTIDLTKNTNNFHVVLRYSDGTPISASDFDCYITADNSVLDHANNIVAQGTPLTYKPYSYDSTRADNILRANFTVGRLQNGCDATLRVIPANSSMQGITLDLLKYLDQIKGNDLPGASLDDYLDRQDDWTIEFILNRESDKLFGLTFKINDWTLVINKFDL